ncbi:MAG: maleylacetoacetate isomerase [Herminiimonas sp.]|nr:maleylacetoacetate isomerase [Herminiimonas sp.]
MELYSYFRSSAAYRVRIALNLKQIDYTVVPVHLVKGGGEQMAPAYRALHADGLVPVLIDGSGPDRVVLTQSLSILEYLEETHPLPALLPLSPAARAYARSIALTIACDIHPINNLRVLRYLQHELGVPDEARDVWYRHWCEHGLAALERTVVWQGRSGDFCLGDTPTLADCALVPQLFNAQRFKCNLTGMPTLLRINANCLALPAFARAAPALQPDAES